MQKSFMEIAHDFLEERKDYIKPSTYALYRWGIENVFVHYFQSMKVPFKSQLQDFALSQKKRGLKAKTIKCRVSLAQSIYYYGCSKGNWPYQKVDVQYPVFEEKRNLPVFTLEEQKKLLRYLDTHFSFHNLGISLCLEEGLRIGEVCSLRFQDIDLEAGILTIRRTIQRVYSFENKKSEIRIDKPKTSSSEREIPLSHSLLRRLKSIGKITEPSHYVLTNSKKPLEPRAFRAYYSRLLKKLDMPQVRFHGLRHSFATRCVEAGCDYKALSAILGHANIGTTLNLYVHPDNRQKKKCIDKMMSRLK